MPDVWVYRLKEAEIDIARKADKEYVDTIAAEIRSLRRILVTFMATVAGSAILVSMTLFATVGTH
ncbi:MAG: hypothetical protein ACXVHB_05875 [Solirubrobacteraceae bacterium]